MTQRKNTKRSLIASVLSVLLCIAMLIGTTFAWFTDRVTNVNNKIVAGNLDVELYYKDGEEYKTVEADTALFHQDDLWEPGYTQTVYLKVKNEGTLALKYQFAVNVIKEIKGTNVDGEEFSLSDYLVFGQAVNDTEVTYATREDAWTAAGATQGLKDYTDEQVLLSNEEKFIALVVYMPTTVGNEANYRGDNIPSIELGVDLVATQTPHEQDSFDENYDTDAEYPSDTITSAEGVMQILNQGGGTIRLGADVTLSDRGEDAPGLKMLENDLVFDLNGHTLNGGNLSLYTTESNVTIKNGTLDMTALGNLGIIVAGDLTIEDATVKTAYINQDHGTMAIRNSTIGLTEQPISIEAESLATFSGNTTITQIGNANAVEMEQGGLTIEGENVSITADSGHAIYLIGGGGQECSLTVNGGTFVGKNGYAALGVQSDDTKQHGFVNQVIIKGGTFTDGNTTGPAPNSSVNYGIILGGDSGTSINVVSITGGTFKGGSGGALIQDNINALNIAGGTFEGLGYDDFGDTVGTYGLDASGLTKGTSNAQLNQSAVTITGEGENGTAYDLGNWLKVIN